VTDLSPAAAATLEADLITLHQRADEAESTAEALLQSLQTVLTTLKQRGVLPADYQLQTASNE